MSIFDTLALMNAQAPALQTLGGELRVLIAEMRVYMTETRETQVRILNILENGAKHDR